MPDWRIGRWVFDSLVDHDGFVALSDINKRPIHIEIIIMPIHRIFFLLLLRFIHR